MANISQVLLWHVCQFMSTTAPPEIKDFSSSAIIRSESWIVLVCDKISA